MLLQGAIPALAHGGTPIVTDGGAGPYRVTVWVQPSLPLRVGRVHLSIALADAASGELVTDVVVRVQAEPPQGGSDADPVSSETTLVGPYYDANLLLESAGDWDVTVLMEGPLGSGQSTVPLSVQEGGLPRWLAPAVAALVLAVGFLAWTASRGSRPASGDGSA
jgi:hypothetical protein